MKHPFRLLNRAWRRAVAVFVAALVVVACGGPVLLYGGEAPAGVGSYDALLRWLEETAGNPERQLTLTDAITVAENATLHLENLRLNTGPYGIVVPAGSALTLWNTHLMGTGGGMPLLAVQQGGRCQLEFSSLAAEAPDGLALWAAGREVALVRSVVDGGLDAPFASRHTCLINDAPTLEYELMRGLDGESYDKHLTHPLGSTDFTDPVLWPQSLQVLFGLQLAPVRLPLQWDTQSIDVHHTGTYRVPGHLPAPLDRLMLDSKLPIARTVQVVDASLPLFVSIGYDTQWPKSYLRVGLVWHTASPAEGRVLLSYDAGQSWQEERGQDDLPRSLRLPVEAALRGAWLKMSAGAAGETLPVALYMEDGTPHFTPCQPEVPAAAAPPAEEAPATPESSFSAPQHDAALVESIPESAAAPLPEPPVAPAVEDAPAPAAEAAPMPAENETPAVAPAEAPQRHVYAAGAGRPQAALVPPVENMLNTDTLLLNGARLHERMEGQPDGVRFEQNGLTLWVPVPYLRTLALAEDAEIRVRMAITEGHKAHIRLLVDGRALEHLPGARVEMPLPPAAQGGQLQCLGADGAPVEDLVADEARRVAGFTVHAPGVYQLHWQNYTPPPTSTARAPQPPDATPAPDAPDRQAEEADFPFGLLALLALAASLAAGGATALALHRADRQQPL